jgi:carbon-monoxide dehydrogenase medium subunit
MKPAPFEYHRPERLDEALELLGRLEGDVKVLAGGQSLIPLMNLRLARPTALIDIGRISELSEIVRSDDVLSIGAMVSHAAVREAPAVSVAVPLLTEAIRHVGHTAVQNRGSHGGSLAHADPAAEVPLVAAALQAEIVAASVRGRRTIAADEFVVGPFMTALQEDELLLQARYRPSTPGDGWGFRQTARRHGDFATVAVACMVRIEAGRCARARLVVGAATDRPTRIAAAEQELRDGEVGDEAAAVRAARAVRAAIEPASDVHGSSEYRKHVAEALTLRVIQDAMRRAQSAQNGAN